MANMLVILQEKAIYVSGGGSKRGERGGADNMSSNLLS